MAKTSKSLPVNTIGVSFAEILGGWDEARLTLLLALRPDLARPAPKTLAGLIQRAGSWPSIQQARWNLDKGAQQALDAACLIPPANRTAAGLVRFLGGPAEATGLSEALARLEARALIISCGDTLVLAPGLAELRHPARLGPPAMEALASHQASTLSAMARRLGVRPGTKRADSLSAVARALSDPARITAVLSAGSTEAAQLARMAAVEGPAVSVRHGVYGLSDRTPAGWLVGHGLLAPMSWDLLVMPREVALVLRGGKPFPNLELGSPPAPTTETDQTSLDAMAAEAAIRLVSDVRTILDMWGRTGPTVLRDGGIGVRELRRAAKAVERTELEAAQVIEIAAAAGLVPCARPGGEVLPLPAYDAWLALEVPQRWACLMLGWLTCQLHPSLSGVLDEKGKAIPALLARSPEPDAKARREIVMGLLLTGVPPGTTISAGCLAAVAQWMGPDVWLGGPASPSTLKEWQIQEARLVGAVVDGALSSFGRVALAEWAAAVHPAAGARFGAAIGGRGEKVPFAAAAASLAQWAPAVSSTFVVQADLSAVAPGELRAAVRSELELLADIESKGAATVYRFSEVSLRRGLDAGRSTTQIMAFLEDHATRGVPQALAYLVGDLGRRFGTVRVGTASCYLRCEDPALVSEILATRRTAKLGMRRLAPTVLVSSADAATTLATLRASGYLPALEDEEGELVVVDVAPRRAQTPPRQAWSALGLPDPAMLAAELRRAAGPPPSIGSPPAFGSTPPVPRPAVPFVFALPTTAPSSSSGTADPLGESVMGMLEELWREQEGAKGPLSGPPGLRPVAIAKDRHSVLGLLDRAYDEDWMVRLCYTSSTGRATQLSAAVVAVERDEVVLECAPRWDERTLRFEQIEWVRVMTGAEEEALP